MEIVSKSIIDCAWLSHGLDDREIGLQFPAREEIFLFATLPRPTLGKAVGAWSCLSSAEVKNDRALTPLPHISSWHGAWLSTETTFLFRVGASTPRRCSYYQYWMALITRQHCFVGIWALIWCSFRCLITY